MSTHKKKHKNNVKTIKIQIVELNDGQRDLMVVEPKKTDNYLKQTECQVQRRPRRFKSCMQIMQSFQNKSNALLRKTSVHLNKCQQSFQLRPPSRRSKPCIQVMSIYQNRSKTRFKKTSVRQTKSHPRCQKSPPPVTRCRSKLAISCEKLRSQHSCSPILPHQLKSSRKMFRNKSSRDSSKSSRTESESKRSKQCCRQQKLCANSSKLIPTTIPISVRKSAICNRISVTQKLRSCLKKRKSISQGSFDKDRRGWFQQYLSKPTMENQVLSNEAASPKIAKAKRSGSKGKVKLTYSHSGDENCSKLSNTCAEPESIEPLDSEFSPSQLVKRVTFADTCSYRTLDSYASDTSGGSRGTAPKVKTLFDTTSEPQINTKFTHGISSEAAIRSESVDISKPLSPEISGREMSPKVKRRSEFSQLQSNTKFRQIPRSECEIGTSPKASKSSEPLVTNSRLQNSNKIRYESAVRIRRRSNFSKLQSNITFSRGTSPKVRVRSESYAGICKPFRYETAPKFRVLPENFVNMREPKYSSVNFSQLKSPKRGRFETCARVKIRSDFSQLLSNTKFRHKTSSVARIRSGSLVDICKPLSSKTFRYQTTPKSRVFSSNFTLRGQMNSMQFKRETSSDLQRPPVGSKIHSEFSYKAINPRYSGRTSHYYDISEGINAEMSAISRYKAFLKNRCKEYDSII